MVLARKLVSVVHRGERGRLLGLTFLMAVGAALDGLGVGLILPLAEILRLRQAAYPGYLRAAWEAVGRPPQGTFVVEAACALLLVFVFKNAYLALLYRMQYALVFRCQAALSSRLLRSYLFRDYAFHLDRSPSQLQRNVGEESFNVFNSVFTPALMIVVEGLVVAVILGILVANDPLATVATVAVLGGAGAALHGAIRRKLAALGQEHSRYASEMVKWLNQGLGAIKDAKVFQQEPFFLGRYSAGIDGYVSSLASFRALSELPRLAIETLAVGAMAIIIVAVVARNGDLQSLTPTLGLFAVAGFRLMPSLNRIVNALASIRYYRPSLDRLIADLEAAPASEPVSPAGPPLAFTESIALQSVTYRYPGAARPSVEGLGFRIQRGTAVAIVGGSGCGKTTTVDLILGLLRPSAGSILVDGIDIQSALYGWQAKIGYIPQPAYLLDDTVRRNVAFGVSDDRIDEGRVREAIHASQLDRLIAELPGGLDTVVGDRGVRLSGGQRQRIGIARALYRNPEVLVMDEATSALDYETEAEIVREIARLSGDRTVIIVAHRLTTVKNCDTLFFLKDGAFVEAGTFEGLLRSNDDFRSLVQAAPRIE